MVSYMLRSVFLFLLFIAAGFSEEELDGNAIFNRVKEKYSKCQTFEGIGTLERKSPDFTDGDYISNFLIRFSRPDKIRVDWEKGIFHKQGKDSIYTEDGKISSTGILFNRFKSIEDAIGTDAGISGGISYFIPMLLLGKNGYLEHWAIVRKKDKVEAGKECYVIEVESKGYGIFTLDVSKNDFSILSSNQVEDGEVQTVQRIRAHQENSNWFNDGGEVKKVTGSSVVTTKFSNIKFDLSLDEVAFHSEKGEKKSSKLFSRREGFYIKWGIPFFFVLISGYFLVVALNPLLSRKPFMMSMHWNFALMCIAFIPSILNGFIFPLSNGFSLIQWVNPFMFAVMLVFFKRQMQGYLIFGASEEYFREALLNSIRSLGYTTEETIGGIKIKETGESIKAVIQGWMGTAQIRGSKEISSKTLESIADEMKVYFSKNSGKMNKISAYFYLVMGGFMIVLGFSMTNLFKKF
ncbi:MAG: hypothetical protein V4507_09495 [Verrucomicrobiota bacterium]